MGVSTYAPIGNQDVGEGLWVFLRLRGGKAGIKVYTQARAKEGFVDDGLDSSRNLTKNEVQERGSVWLLNSITRSSKQWFAFSWNGGLSISCAEGRRLL